MQSAQFSEVHHLRTFITGTFVVPLNTVTELTKIWQETTAGSGASVPTVNTGQSRNLQDLHGRRTPAAARKTYGGQKCKKHTRDPQFHMLFSFSQ